MSLFPLILATVVFILCGCQTSNDVIFTPTNNESTTNKINDLTPSLSLPSSPPTNADIAPPAPGPFDDTKANMLPLYNNLPGGSHSDRSSEYIHFVPNFYDFWINPNFATKHLLAGCTGSDCECEAGEENCEAIPAFANIVVEASNFVMCKGGPFAICYYSGSTDESVDIDCVLTEDGRFADCKCFSAWGVYLVDINAILNYAVYQETIAACGADGLGCSGSENVNKAPVCAAINNNTLIPGADMLSVFSFNCVPTNGLGQTNCPENIYAGCMTAPCQTTPVEGIVNCSCPTFLGPYQVGTTLPNPEEECTLGNNLVWSAAFNPAGSTIPPTSPCIPDAPGGNGCPLYDCTMEPPEGTDCEAICLAYACTNSHGIEPAFTCDATLCTSECNDQQLVQAACTDLKDCSAAGLKAIADLEAAVGCSCCASQLCNCQPNIATDHVIYDLNQQQRELTIVPQCDVNGTLCGQPICNVDDAGCTTINPLINPVVCDRSNHQ